MAETRTRTTFDYRPNFKGSVIIRQGDHEMTVAVEDLEKLIGEKVRYELQQRVADMKTRDLLVRNLA